MLKNKDFSSLVKRNLEECHFIWNKKIKSTISPTQGDLSTGKRAHKWVRGVSARSFVTLISFDIIVFHQHLWNHIQWSHGETATPSTPPQNPTPPSLHAVTCQRARPFPVSLTEMSSPIMRQDAARWPRYLSRHLWPRAAPRPGGEEETRWRWGWSILMEREKW